MTHGLLQIRDMMHIIRTWEAGEMQTLISGVLGNSNATLADLLLITEKPATPLIYQFFPTLPKAMCLSVVVHVVRLAIHVHDKEE